MHAQDLVRDSRIAASFEKGVKQHGLRLGAKKEPLLEYFNVMKQGLLNGFAPNKVRVAARDLYGEDPLHPTWDEVASNSRAPATLERDQEKIILAALPAFEDLMDKNGEIEDKDFKKHNVKRSECDKSTDDAPVSDRPFNQRRAGQVNAKEARARRAKQAEEAEAAKKAKEKAKEDKKKAAQEAYEAKEAESMKRKLDAFLKKKGKEEEQAAAAVRRAKEKIFREEHKEVLAWCKAQDKQEKEAKRAQERVNKAAKHNQRKGKADKGKE